MRWVYDKRKDKLVPAEAYHRPAGVQIISDSMPDTWHPSNGKHYDSKSEFRRATKAHGGIEVGTEKQVDRRDLTPKGVKRDVIEAIRKVNQGYRPETERQKFTGDGWQ